MKCFCSCLRLTCIGIGIIGVLVGVLASSGCNTWKGAGKDVEATGDAMQGD
jgi:predicted small secreted protein